MEFGCRYIYVDDQIIRHTEGSRSPRISLPNGPIHDVANPDSDVYDNVEFEGISQASSSIDVFFDTHTENAFKAGQLSPTGTGPGLPGATPVSQKSLSVVSAYPKVEKSPPPVPSRDTKPPLVEAPDFAHPDSDVYDNVEFEGISQASSSTDVFFDTHTENAFKTGQPSPTGTGPGLPGAAPVSQKSLSVVSAYPKVEKSPPPVPSRDTKPPLVPAPDFANPGSDYVGSEGISNGFFDTHTENAFKTGQPSPTGTGPARSDPGHPYDYVSLPPPVPSRSKKPPLTQVLLSEVITGAVPVSQKSPSVVSAYPKVEKSPPPVPSRGSKLPLVPAPDTPQRLPIQSSFENSDYVDVLPATPEELKSQRIPVCKENSSLDLRPDTPQRLPIQSSFENSDYVDVLPATPEELKSQRIPVCKQNSSLDLRPDVAPKLLANCNILLLNVGKLVDVPGTPSSESPLLCSNCAAGLLALNNIQKNKDWTCVFCGSVNTIEEGKKYYNFAEDEVFLGKPGGQHGSAGEDMLIFCIDISGSMSVTSEMQSESSPDDNNHVLHTSRMEVVKFGLMQSLNFLYVHNAKKRVALVTFSDQVKLYGDGTRNPQILEDTELLDPDYLKSQGESQPLPNPIDETIDSLRSKIECLKEKGATALGPAALVSIAMASQRPGSKVIICTDGRANTDLGNLEDISEESVYQSSRLYYSKLADLALQNSVVVSVVTIEGTDCRLPELGQLADKTGGKVNIVNPSRLADEFQSILEEEINATDVTVKVYLPKSMYFLYESHTNHVLERTIGSSTEDTILSMEFGIHTSKIKEVLRQSQLPVQVQLTFSLPDGRRRHRIMNQKRPVTNDSSAAFESINVIVLQTHSAQISAQLAMEGRVDEATKVALALKDLIAQVMKHGNHENQCEEYEKWEDCMSPIYEELQMYMKVDQKHEEGAPNMRVLKTFSDEMATMMFRLKAAKNRVLQKLKPCAE